ncbi:MAG: DUF6241 domain-containing protein [Clostridium sp.]
MREGTLKKILIWLIVIVIVLGAGLFGYTYYMNYKTGKFEAKKNQKEIENIVEDINEEKDSSEAEEKPEEKELKSSDYYPESKVYDIMHRMSNTKIIAEDNKIWGELLIDSESLGSIKALVSEIDYPDRDYLLSVITKWENGDFSKADEDHNYFWAKLGGTIGKAIGIKE